jgi:hypothetical protein
MYRPHLYNEYIKGVDAFIDFTKKDILDNIRGNLCCTPNNKIRKACIRIVVYVLMLMMLRVKTKICNMVKYKRSGSLTFTVSIFLFSIATGLMQSGVLYKMSMDSLALTLTIKDIRRSLLC